MAVLKSMLQGQGALVRVGAEAADDRTLFELLRGQHDADANSSKRLIFLLHHLREVPDAERTR